MRGSGKDQPGGVDLDNEKQEQRKPGKDGHRVFNHALLLMGRREGRICGSGHCSKDCSRVIQENVFTGTSQL